MRRLYPAVGFGGKTARRVALFVTDLREFRDNFRSPGMSQKSGILGDSFCDSRRDEIR
jgi:hypothetical protein